MSHKKRRSSGKFFGLVLSAAIFIIAGVQAFGQTQAFTASLGGTVSDPQDEVLAGARVTLTSSDRGVVRTFITKDTGLYTFTLLPPGVYALEVEAQGFKHYKQ